MNPILFHQIWDPALFLCFAISFMKHQLRPTISQIIWCIWPTRTKNYFLVSATMGVIGLLEIDDFFSFLFLYFTYMGHSMRNLHPKIFYRNKYYFSRSMFKNNGHVFFFNMIFENFEKWYSKFYNRKNWCFFNGIQ